jgi:transcriptional regulator with PAS, ATPase and Fis domain
MAAPVTENFLSDADAVRRRAMLSLFEQLDSLCEGAVAVDRHARIVWINDKYRTMLGIGDMPVVGREVEEVIPHSALRRIVETGQPILLDIMPFGTRSFVVTRVPVDDESGQVIGAVGFVLYDSVRYLKPLMTKFSRLQAELEQVRRRLVEQRRARYTLQSYVGDSPPCLEVKRQARRAAGHDAPVLLLGETGTGKELLAQAIHAASERANRPFVGVNVAAVPETLMEAEFFGTVAGAYTGADRRGREGRFKSADGGTLVLDEIGDMPLPLQTKLLRALQEQEIEPVGSDRVFKVDVRVIAATHVNLQQRVKEGRFRADLFYRLNVLTIRLPTLREIRSDLEALCETLLADISARTGMPRRGVSPGGIAALAGHDWPGNVRELRNVLERACMLTDNLRLTAEDFAGILPVTVAAEAAETLPEGGPEWGRRLAPVQPYDEAFAEFERRTLTRALEAAGGRVPDAARLLGVSRANFYKKMAKVGLEPGSAGGVSKARPVSEWRWGSV